MAACSKSSSSVDDSAAVLGKWTLVSHRDKTSKNGVNIYDQTSIAPAGEYINFKSNGTYMYRTYDSSLAVYVIDSSTYHVSGTNLLDYGNGTNYQIQNLTSTAMTLYASSEFTFSGVTQKDENWLNLTR